MLFSAPIFSIRQDLINQTAAEAEQSKLCHYRQSLRLPRMTHSTEYFTVRIGVFGGGGGNRTRVLRGVSKSFYMLSSLFVFSPHSGSSERDPEEVSLYFLASLSQARPAGNKSPAGSKK